ncbi:hypothetical protein D6D01_02063 [Aureobasidium pullulans]|uniref:1-alkyl-2-acetylglycerophosphocholine esterase n=1 Tax=Aureobasidium pullulans TaxID=5580 RepID=A0A4S9LVM0_AURPU|nr:hypothetical protein D6D01_02063 [Aureobasidium pullulans]
MLLFPLLLAINSAVTIASSSPSQVVLPKPTGRYLVGQTASVELIDYSRVQPFAPGPEPIRLEISLFYPVIDQQHHKAQVNAAAYFPAVVAQFEDAALSDIGVHAPNGTFGKLALHLASDETCQRSGSHEPEVDFPLAIFMPGEGTTRLWYSQIAATVASNGYIVITIDPPYNVDVIEYLDGSLVLLNKTLWDTENYEALARTAYVGIQSQAQDVSFVLDQLSNVTLARTLVPNLPASGFNTTTAMFGHSLGGSTAYSILEQDARVLGGLDMDGGLFGPGNGTDKPVMIMGCGNHTRDHDGDFTQITWAATWPNLTGWRREITIADTLHYDFSDYPVVFETLGITPNLTIASSSHGTQTGTLEGHRVLEIVTSYVTAFLDLVIKGKNSPLLDGPVARFPEVAFQY